MGGWWDGEIFPNVMAGASPTVRRMGVGPGLGIAIVEEAVEGVRMVCPGVCGGEEPGARPGWSAVS